MLTTYFLFPLSLSISFVRSFFSIYCCSTLCYFIFLALKHLHVYRCGKYMSNVRLNVIWDAYKMENKNGFAFIIGDESVVNVASKQKTERLIGENRSKEWARQKKQSYKISWQITITNKNNIDMATILFRGYRIVPICYGNKIRPNIWPTIWIAQSKWIKKKESRVKKNTTKKENEFIDRSLKCK